MDKTNGVRAEWRDTTAAHVALLEPEKVEQRIAIAGRMLRDGATYKSIVAETKAQTGTGIGAGTLTRLRRAWKKAQKKAERAAARAAKGVALRAKKPPPLPSKADAPVTPPGWVQLPGDIAVISALVAAGAPFVFDGKRVSMKAGR